MAKVAASFAEWLRSQELIEPNALESVAASWGDLATDGRLASPLALRADAASEGRRQLEFLGSPLAVETVELPGRHSGLVGSCRRILSDPAEYAGAPAVFVIGAEEREGGTTLLTVLRRVEAT